MPLLRELVARNLGVSRTAAARLIASGRVSALDGTPLGPTAALPDVTDSKPPSVAVDGEPLVLWTRALVVLHKPPGVVTALRDGRHPTAYTLLREAPLHAELRPVGRLDLDTSGLLLWTTEGTLIQRLTHPKRRVPRTYQAALAGPFRALPADLALADGYRPQVVALREISSAEAHPALARPPQAQTLAAITVEAGAYHEVRRIFAALGSHVLGLCRTHFGPYQLPDDLPPGAWRSLPLSSLEPTSGKPTPGEPASGR